MSYEPPKTIWEVERKLSFNTPLQPDDPRFVETEAVRGAFSFTRLLKPLGINPKDWRLMFRPRRVYSLLCGHRGCGKSTELRRLASRLDDPERFFVIFLDATLELDPNNMQYSEILLALAKALVEKLERESLTIEQVHLTNLQTWFKERIEENTLLRDYASEIKAGAKIDSGLPFLGSLFASLTNSFRLNSTHKETLRGVLTNSFSQFADAFNQLIRAAEAEVVRRGKGKAVLFVVDGTDRLGDTDTHRFFIGDVHQLQQIESNFIYCAPIHLLYESNQVQQSFQHCVLPMIKLVDKRSDVRIPAAYEALRALVYRRADPAVFDAEETVDQLIEYSGGNPRELLKLLHYCFQLTETERMDMPAAARAVRELATDYRRILEATDYGLLFDVDRSDEADTNSARARHLLYNLALLEYNSFWWRSHPVVRTLPGYRRLVEQHNSCADQGRESGSDGARS